MDEAKSFFADVQSKEKAYKPMITENDLAPMELNTAIMEKFKPQLSEFYYDETKYDTYIEQLN